MTKATAKARKTKPGTQSGFNSRFPLVFGFEVILRDIFLYRQGNRLSPSEQLLEFEVCIIRLLGCGRE